MFKFLWAALLAAAVFVSCDKRDDNAYKTYVSDPILYCNTVKQLNNVVLENNFPPMIASRNYAYATIAAFETIVPFDNRFQSLAGQIKHLSALPAYDTTDVDHRLASLLAFCKVGEAVTFPEGSLEKYVKALLSNVDSAGISGDVMKASRRYADSVAAHILRWSKGDNYLQLRTAPKFTITSEEGRWTPTPPMYGQAVEPHWAEMRCLVMDSCAQFIPVAHPKFDLSNKNSSYYRALMEVKSIGDSLTQEQKEIADFWDDNPFKMNVTGHVMYATKKFSPAGHWMNIVGIAAKEAKADFETTVAAYAHTAIALYEAFISCWDEKFRSNLVRPETVINKIVSSEWQPYIQTPPFPSYTSGHATISAAAAETMTYWFGDTLSFVDTSLVEFGLKSRNIQSFRQAAEEAAMSRLYGGIHYRFDNDHGNQAGRKLGEYIVSRIRLKKNETN
jgi:hypothetical protein